jgi:hypothetical protein
MKSSLACRLVAGTLFFASLALVLSGFGCSSDPPVQPVGLERNDSGPESPSAPVFIGPGRSPVSVCDPAQPGASGAGGR